MALSDVQIANRALSKLGDQRILALTDDTKPAREMNAAYAMVRDQELRRHRWKFAIKRDLITADATPTAWGFVYAYQLPADYLGLVQVGQFYVVPYAKHQSLWTVEGRKLLTDMEPQLPIRYVSRVESPSDFDVLFAECLACKLAMETCEALTQNAQKKTSATEEYKFALTEAMRADALEIPPDQLPWGSWLESREGPGGTLGIQSADYGASGFVVA